MKNMQVHQVAKIGMEMDLMVPLQYDSKYGDISTRTDTIMS